jgi:glutamine synthetase
MVPRALADALTALEADHEFLLQGGTFSKDFVQGWVETKRVTEVVPMAIRPHPYEYQLYLDA